MSRNNGLSHWVMAGVLLAAALMTAMPASAQRYYYGGGGGGGFFGSLFGGGGGGSYYPQRQREYSGGESSGDYSRAPSAKKSDTTPTASVMVMGDSMADWLAYGLEEAFADAPEIGIQRRHKTYSGLIRYEARTDLDWSRVARDLLAKDRTDVVVMMLGTNDRAAIRETAADRKKNEPVKPAQPPEAGQGEQAAQTETRQQDDDEAIVAPEPQRGGSSAEFRSERWEQIYTKRVDETIAALKSKGAPVIWVGLPAIRGTRSTADAQYLNQLYRARAEANGILYVDVWDGFVDEAGKFTYQGPDFEGQTRRLRAGDGVHFTKHGARKLAHFVERELRRFMSNRSLPMAIPSGPQLQSVPGEPAARPAAGPVVSLTASTSGGGELLGGRGTSPIHSDATAARVLVKGEPVPPAPGRADDFRWPRGGEASAAAVAEPPPAAAAAPARPEPPKQREAARDPKPGTQPDAKRQTQDQRTGTRTGPGAASTQQQDQRPRTATRPPQQVPQNQQQRSTGPFGLFR